MNELLISILYAAAGGVLIGVAALIMLAFNGRIAGISGILGGIMNAPKTAEAWRWAFVGGMVATGAVLTFVMPGRFPEVLPRSMPLIVAAGLFVGVGTRMGSGCTSGHGVCGIGRLSPRSIAATVTFMATGVASVAFVRFVLGGA
jgi:uncharacterized membrane protein YedE/YeeE